jgi:hypothetical protein
VGPTTHVIWTVVVEASELELAIPTGAIREFESLELFAAVWTDGVFLSSQYGL